MSADSHESRAGAPHEARLPGMLDAWRMVAARRGFEGTLPLSSMERLRDALCDTEGEVRYVIEFDRDALQVPADGALQPAELIEDELILAVPVGPVAPGSEAVEQDWPLPGTEAGEELEKANPFAALAALKKRE